MAEKTLYDILEVSSTASPQAIRAAYERLSASAEAVVAADSENGNARIQLTAIKDAFFTLGNADKRAVYDRKIERREYSSIQRVEVVETFWTMPKLLLIGLVIVILGGFYYSHQKQQAKLEAEKVIATAKAKEAEAKAQAEAEAARYELQQQREARAAETMRRAEGEAAVRQMQQDNLQQSIISRNVSTYDRNQERREEMEKRNADQRRLYEEQRATAAARQQVAREKADLCRMERERYGRVISC